MTATETTLISNTSPNKFQAQTRPARALFLDSRQASGKARRPLRISPCARWGSSEVAELLRQQPDL